MTAPGPTDHAQVCRSRPPCLNSCAHRAPGFAAGRNRFRARRSWSFDDVPGADRLLEAHLEPSPHPENCICILGTAAGACRHRLLLYVDVGRLPFSIPCERPSRLDFTYFWGGRRPYQKSAPRRIFRREMRHPGRHRTGYRLSKLVSRFFDRTAVQYMNPPSIREFAGVARAGASAVRCKRSLSRGRRRIAKYCQPRLGLDGHKWGFTAFRIEASEVNRFVGDLELSTNSRSRPSSKQ